MFLILNSSNLIIGISAYAHYVKQQTNGVKISCLQEEAQAIYSANTDSFYPMETAGFIGDTHTLVEVDGVPPEVVAGYYSYRDGEYYITEEKQTELSRKKASDDMLEMVVDQEYRLMLLELGV